MKKIVNKLLFWIRFDRGRSLIGLLIGLLAFAIVFWFFKILWMGIVVGVIVTCISITIIHFRNMEEYSDNYYEFNKKERFADPSKLRGFSKNVDDILDLDKELTDFLDKYSSGKKPDYFERELNRQWKIHGKEFEERADKIFSSMSNQELMVSLLGIDHIKDIVNIFDYFKPYVIDIDYLKEHPEKAKEYYLDNLLQQDAIEKYALNEYYYKKIMNLNYFDEIEKFLLSQMSNEDLMELANSSKDWYDKLYYYEFLKKEDDKKMSK